MNLSLLSQNPLAIVDIPNPSYMECLVAVNGNPDAIQYVPQTEELCLIAVTFRPRTIRFVREQTDKVCVMAIENDGCASDLYQYITNWSEYVCLVAVSKYGMWLEKIPLQTKEICVAAIISDSNALQFVKDQDDEICRLAVTISPKAIKYVADQQEDLCLLAVKADGNALQYIKKQTPRLCRAAVKQDAGAIQFVENQTPDLCYLAIKSKVRTIDLIRNPNIALQLFVIKRINCSYDDYTPDFLKYKIIQNRDCDFGKIRTLDETLCFLKNEGNFYSVNENMSDESLFLVMMRSKNDSRIAIEIANKSKDLSLLYVSTGMDRLRHIADPTEEICVAAVIKDPSNLVHSIPSDLVYQKAIETHPSAIKYIKNPCEALCIEAIRHHPNALQYIQNQTIDMCREAFGLDPLTFQWIKDDEIKIQILNFGGRTKSARMIMD